MSPATLRRSSLQGGHHCSFYCFTHHVYLMFGCFTHSTPASYVSICHDRVIASGPDSLLFEGSLVRFVRPIRQRSGVVITQCLIRFDLRVISRRHSHGRIGLQFLMPYRCLIRLSLWADMSGHWPILSADQATSLWTYIGHKTLCFWSRRFTSSVRSLISVSLSFCSFTADIL